MNLQSTIELQRPLRPSIGKVWAYGTSEGATKGWDTRGRGRKTADSRSFILPNGREIEVSNDHATQDKQLEQIRKEELAKLPERVQQAFAKGVDSEGIYRHNGQWEQERAELHAQIIQSYLEGHQAQANPHMAIVAGGTASGKSAASKTAKGETPDFVYVNTDNIRAMLPEIGAFVGNDKQGLLHEEAGHLRDELLAAATQGRMNVILDAPGSQGVVDLAAEAEKRGYSVGVDYVHRDVESSQSAALGRKYIADELPDLREVPKDVTFGSHMKARKALEPISRGRELRVWDNEQGFPGKMVFWRTANGETRVYNGDRLGVIAHGQNSQLPEIPDKAFR